MALVGKSHTDLGIFTRLGRRQAVIILLGDHASMRKIGMAVFLCSLNVALLAQARPPLEEPLQRAAREIQVKNFTAAEQLLEAALRRDPRSFAAQNLMGLMRLGQGRTTDARHAFEEATRINPAYAPAHVN